MVLLAFHTYNQTTILNNDTKRKTAIDDQTEKLHVLIFLLLTIVTLSLYFFGLEIEETITAMLPSTTPIFQLAPKVSAIVATYTNTISPYLLLATLPLSMIIWHMAYMQKIRRADKNHEYSKMTNKVVFFLIEVRFVLWLVISSYIWYFTLFTQ